MRMKKLAAVLSAAAMAVSSLAVGAFAEGEATKQLVKGIELLGTQSEAGVTATLTDKTETNEGVTYQVVEVCVKDPTKLKNQPNGGMGDKIYIGLGIEFDGAIKDVDNSNIQCDGYTGKNVEGETSFKYSAERTEYQKTMGTTAKEGMMWYFVFDPDKNTVEYFNGLCNYYSKNFFSGYARKYSATINGTKYETNLYFKFVPYVEPAPAAPEFNLPNTAKEGTSAKNDYKSGTENHFNYQYYYNIFDNASFDSVKAIKDTDVKVNLISTDPTAPAGAESFNLNLVLDVTKTGNKWSQLDTSAAIKCGESKTITVKAEDIAKVTGTGTKFAADDKISLYLVFNTAQDVEFTTEPKFKFAFGEYKAPAEETTTPAETEAPSGGNNAGYVVITPNDTTAADTTAAAPEVVTGANGESVEAPKDVVPEGAVLEAKEQTKEEAVKAVEAVKTTDDNKDVVETVKKSVEDGKAAVLDINLVKDGVKVQPDGTIKVTINIPEILKNAAQLFVYRVEDNGTFTDVKATVSGGKLVFSTGHFSTYIITSEALTGNAVVTEATTAAPAETTAATTANGSTSTEDKNQATGVVLAVIPVILAAAGVVTAKKRK